MLLPGARLQYIVPGPVLRLWKYRLPEWQTVLHLTTPSFRHFAGPRPQHYGGRRRMSQRTDARRQMHAPYLCSLPRLPTPSPTLCVSRAKVMPVGPVQEDAMSAEVGSPNCRSLVDGGLRIIVSFGVFRGRTCSGAGQSTAVILPPSRLRNDVLPSSSPEK